MTSEVERVRDAVQPVLDAHHLELYDVEVHRTVVRVIVDRPGGVGLDDIGTATPAISRAVDNADPIPHRYTLEVTSPGVERPLRTPDQFMRAVGETVKVKVAPGADDERRLQGVLTAADDTSITLQVDEQGTGPGSGPTRTLAYDDIARARTVFEWNGGKQERERRS
jgi:ribosome maturation factor RimP